MRKDFVSVVFDRKKTVEKKGEAAVEIYIYLGRTERKYITFSTCNPIEWRRLQRSADLMKEVSMYAQVVDGMIAHHEEMTVSNFEAHIGIAPKENKVDARRKKLLASRNGFIEFILEESAKENLQDTTRRRIKSALDAMERYGKILRFADLTDKNVRGFDDFLRREDRTRTEVCLNNYHKIVKKYSRLAFQMEYIPKNPYDSPLCKFKRGECKQRKPLTEDELLVVLKLQGLTAGEEHARDLFVFSAFTGLAYADNQNFDFDSMTQKSGKTYYIVGERLKNGHSFFTPILPPAMDILKKYDYELPKMSNQKMNQFLHLVEARAKLRKPMTSHVARHSFATIALNHDIPMEDVAKMLGHTNINTTKIYAKLMTKTIERHAEDLIASMSGFYD